jgi:hypothetical protein
MSGTRAHEGRPAFCFARHYLTRTQEELPLRVPATRAQPADIPYWLAIRPSGWAGPSG